MPKNTVNTMSGRMCARVMTSGKSLTVKVLTIWSPMDCSALSTAALVVSIVMLVSGLKIAVTMNMMAPAIAAVMMNIAIVMISSFPTRRVSPMAAMELEIEKKISGTRRTKSMFSQI